MLAITPPEPAGGVLDVPAEVVAELQRHPVQPARVKWFDKGKGFGFANVFGRSEDVFVHIEVLRQSGLADLQAGEAVGLRIAEGKRGQMAVQVVAWDVAVRCGG